MYYSNKDLYQSHKGFSLLELIIVVLIVSLIGFLVFSSFVKQQQKVKALDPSTLPATFRESFKGQGDIELFCIKKCQECYVLKGANISPYDGGLDFGKNIEVHLLDDDNRFVKIDDFGRVQDQKVCLRYKLYANGSATQMVIVNEDKKGNDGIYFLPSYFGIAKKVEDMQEAKELWVKEDYSLRDSGSFY